jgi:hypothetical protein
MPAPLDLVIRGATIRGEAAGIVVRDGASPRSAVT